MFSSAQQVVEETSQNLNTTCVCAMLLSVSGGKEGACQLHSTAGYSCQLANLICQLQAVSGDLLSEVMLGNVKWTVGSVTAAVDASFKKHYNRFASQEQLKFESALRQVALSSWVRQLLVSADPALMIIGSRTVLFRIRGHCRERFDELVALYNQHLFYVSVWMHLH